MYSVIILNSKTLEYFLQYQPLFTEALNTNKIGICKWNEYGTNIDSALPELNNLIEDKKEWRAIIIRLIDDNCMAAYKTLKQNPFDFIINSKQENGDIQESEVPLIRLTHMLGGIPPLDIKFRNEIIQENHKAPRTVYVPVVDEVREIKYETLKRKYDFDGKRPSSILIFSVRKRENSSNSIYDEWRTHKESESSEFWRRNCYPSICRFLIYDYQSQGRFQKEADCFNFFLTVFLLAINDIDSSVLQAYRVYTVKAIMNKEEMDESFQVMVDYLKDIKYTITRDIKKHLESQIYDVNVLPEYKVEVPVILKLPKLETREVNENSFSLLSDGAISDLTIWNIQCNEIEQSLVNSVRKAEKSLDQTIAKMRNNYKFNEDEIKILNKYQEQELEDQMKELLRKIIRIQGALPTEKINTDERIMEAKREIRNILSGRVLKQSVIVICIMMIVLLIVSVIPAFFYQVNRNNVLVLLLVYFLIFICTSLISFSVLLYQKNNLNRSIYTYNQCMRSLFNKLIDNAEGYSKYISAIATYSKGASYLNLSEAKEEYLDREYKARYKHIKAINSLLRKLMVWSKAFYLDVDFDSGKSETYVDIDTMKDPIECRYYSFETGEIYLVEINNSGINMESPFSFVKKIEIIREELYDD